MSKLFIGNLAWHTTEAELQELFQPYGFILAVDVVRDKDTGRGRGFGFVEFQSEADANMAIQYMNDYALDGKSIRVAPANS